MSSISSSPFLHFVRPEVLPPPVGGLQLIPEKDLAEWVSDLLLGFSRMGPNDTWDLSVVGNALHLELKRNDNLILEYICCFIAWTVWLPCTLLGLLIVQFSASHSALYLKAHAESWVSAHQETLSGGPADHLDHSVPFTPRQTALFEEAMGHDHLFDALLNNVDKFPQPAFHIPLLLENFKDPAMNGRLLQLLDRLTPARLTEYVFHYLVRVTTYGATRNDFILDYCFTHPHIDDDKKLEKAAAGIMGIVKAASEIATSHHALSIPNDDKIFSQATGAQVEAWIKMDDANGKFIESNRMQILNGLPTGHRYLLLRNLVAILTSNSPESDTDD